jgi:hypothetical protein
MTSRHFAAFALVLLAAGTLLAAVPQPVTIPAGTEIHFKLLHAINTANAKPGQNVAGALTQPIVIGGRTVAASGAAVNVHITTVEASGRIGGSAKLVFHVSSVTLTNGSRMSVHTRSYSREGRAHAKHNAKYIAGAAVVGALAGQALGGNRDATAKGAAIGAGVGIGAAAATGKFDFTVPAGERFELSLKSSVTANL